MEALNIEVLEILRQPINWMPAKLLNVKGSPARVQHFWRPNDFQLQILETQHNDVPRPRLIHQTFPNTTATMAEGGIDRKAEEKMEFTTSKDVVVSPTFQDMHLKGK